MFCLEKIQPCCAQQVDHKMLLNVHMDFKRREERKKKNNKQEQNNKEKLLSVKQKLIIENTKNNNSYLLDILQRKHVLKPSFQTLFNSSPRTGS